MDKATRQALDLISVRLGCDYTEEQREFSADFTTPLVSFSDAGTGKSHSIVAGLILAQTHHGIPGRKINAMSFTKMATNELKSRYSRACNSCGITPTVKFNTFHSICNTILKEKYPTMKVRGYADYARDLEVLGQYMEKYGLESDNFYYSKSVLAAINSLNSALTYDDASVKNSYAFKKLEMDIEIFQQLRRDWFVFGLTTKTISLGDIPVYTLYILLHDPALCKRYKELYKIMVVDEFQDMTKLHLKILALISSNLIVIGDMKQQIYGFNGASQQIVQEYRKMYPNARTVNLTKSWRCKDEIANYATPVVYMNDNNVVAFTGMGEGGSVKTMPSREMDLQAIIASIKEEQETKGFAAARDTMFLFRNNFSAVPIAEELYKQGLLFRVNGFKRVMELDIFKDICEIIDAALEPKSTEKLNKIMRIFPEFKNCHIGNNTLFQVMVKTNTSIFDVPYQFAEESSREIIRSMKKAVFMVQQEQLAGQIFSALLKVYEDYVIGKDGWWKLDMPKEFYFDLVAPISETKTYPTLVKEENDKKNKIDNSVSVGMGVRCYTIHTAKGLEAEDIYIIDADQGLFPSKKAMSRYVQAQCEYEAAKDVRNERNLLYVAITRAKDNVIITYNTELTELLSDPKENSYTYLDDIYDATDKDFDDVGAFLKLFNIEDVSKPVHCDMVAQGENEYARDYGEL